MMQRLVHTSDVVAGQIYGISVVCVVWSGTYITCTKIPARRRQTPVALINRAGFPAAVMPGGTGTLTTAPAAMVARAPTSAMMIDDAPIQQSAPILTSVSSPDPS